MVHLVHLNFLLEISLLIVHITGLPGEFYPEPPPTGVSKFLIAQDFIFNCRSLGHQMSPPHFLPGQPQ